MLKNWKNNYLIHYGVKGMKWGVRKDRYSNFNAYRQSVQKITKNRDGSYSIPRGYIFNRVGSNSLDFNKSGCLYVSYGKDDAARYVRNLGPSLIGRLTKQSHYTVQHIKSTSNINMASESQTISMLTQALQSNKNAKQTLDNSIYSLGFLDGKPRSNKRTALAVSAMLGNNNYYKTNKYFINYCKKQGFDAIPDLNDLYTGTGKTSTIIINPEKIKIYETTHINKDVYKSGKRYANSLGKLPMDEIVK